MDSQIADQPIRIPGNPFWNIFRRFGRDEAVALIINLIGTVFINFFSNSPGLIAVAGPILEKLGFFPMHFKEAVDIYNTTNPKKRKSRYYYFKKASKNGMKSLIQDVCIHDPIYIVFMYFGLTIYPGTPVWLLSISSFVIAVFAVSAIELSYTEIKYYLFKQRQKNRGFKIESYYESRFIISSKVDPKKILKKIAKEYNLKYVGALDYRDHYFENKLNEYSGRTAKIRIRDRSKKIGPGQNHSIQIIYSRAQEHYLRKFEQYRFFPIKKDKIYFLLDKDVKGDIDNVQNNDVKKKILKSIDKRFTKKVSFSRDVAHDDEVLVVSDRVHNTKNLVLLEVKVYTDINLLKKVMRYVMKEFPVDHTTYSKEEIVV